VTTIKCKLVAVQEGQYTTYVFSDMNQSVSSPDKYIMCTKLPNWQYSATINIGDIGYLQYEYVEAGSLYYHPESNTSIPYKYSNFYFMNFLKEVTSEDTTNKDYKF